MHLAHLYCHFILIFHVAYRRDRILAFWILFDLQGRGFHYSVLIAAWRYHRFWADGRKQQFFLPSRTRFHLCRDRRGLGLVGALV
jgi:hypothetical protein